MGAEVFITYAEGVDVQAAFRSAVDRAEYDHGHAGGTGTIAEKDDYIVIDSTPQSESDARALANRLIENRDSRIDDRWGPAGAIAVHGGFRTLPDLPVPARTGGYPDARTAALAAVEDRLADGETVGNARVDLCRPRRRGFDVDERTTVTVTTVGSPELTGWLFFGWAKS